MNNHEPRLVIIEIINFFIFETVTIHQHCTLI